MVNSRDDSDIDVPAGIDPQWNELSNHGLRQPVWGSTDWDIPLNENVETLDTHVAMKGLLSQRPAMPKEGSWFVAHDHNRIDYHDGDQWRTIAGRGSSTTPIPAAWFTSLFVRPSGVSGFRPALTPVYHQGNLVTTGPARLNFAGGLDVTTNQAGEVTITSFGTGSGAGAERPHHTHLPMTTLLNNEYARLMFQIPPDDTFRLREWGAINDTGSTPSGLVLEMRDANGSVVASQSTDFSQSASIGEVSEGPVELRLVNETGSTTTAGAIYGYELSQPGEQTRSANLPHVSIENEDYAEIAFRVPLGRTFRLIGWGTVDGDGNTPSGLVMRVFDGSSERANASADWEGGDVTDAITTINGPDIVSLRLHNQTGDRVGAGAVFTYQLE